jgi:signal transduction histidine kinase/ActR/RegA family two-component response regulator
VREVASPEVPRARPATRRGRAAAIARATADLSQHPSLETLLQAVVALVVEVLDADAAHVELRLPDGVRTASAGGTDPEPGDVGGSDVAAPAGGRDVLRAEVRDPSGRPIGSLQVRGAVAAPEQGAADEQTVLDLVAAVTSLAVENIRLRASLDVDARAEVLHRLEQAVENSADGVIVVDAVRDEHGRIEDFAFRMVNPAARVLSTRGGLLGRTMRESFPEFAATGLLATFADVVAGGRPRDDEFHWVDPDSGREDWWQSTLIPADDGLMVLFRRTTEQHLSARALREAERRVHEAYRIGRLGFYEWRWGGDRPGFESSDELIELLGLPRRPTGVEPEQREPGEELPGGDPAGRAFPARVQAVLELLHPEDRERARRLMDTAWSGGRPTPTDLRLVRPDGRTVVLRAEGEAILDEQGQAVGVRGTLRDVTEERSLQAQLQHSQRSENLGQLAAGVAHDVNNLLTVIGVNAALLRRTLEERDLPADDARAIEEVTQRGATLTRQLLAFTGQQVLNPVVVEIDEVMTRLVPLVRRVLDERVSLHYRSEPEVPPVLIDPGQLEQVILNLVINARDAVTERVLASSGQGRVTLSVAVEDGAALRRLGRRFQADLAPGARLVAVRVRDDGVGMPSEVLARALDPFFTTKPTGRGTGLGLAVADGIVRQSDGLLTLESEAGRGTTATVWLPAAAEPAAPAPPPRPEPPLHAGRERVLVVEDDPVVRQLTARLLAHLGHDVLEADGPEQALALPRDVLAGVQVLVSDVVMPGLTGDALLERLREQHPRLAAVLMSGYAPGVGPARSVPGGEPLLGSAVFLAKPFTTGELAAAVRSAMARAAR